MYSWRHRNLSAAKPFTLACLFGALWTLGTILEISAVDFSTKVFWLKFQTVWQQPSAMAVLCFVLAYAGLERFLNRRNVLLISIVPLLVIVLIITNDFHQLIWAGFQMDRHVTVSSGTLYWIFIGYVFLAGLVNVVVLVRLAIRSPSHRWPVAIILSGQILARAGYALDKLDTSMIGPGESVLLVVGVVSTAYAIAFFWFHTIDPVATARIAVLQQMREGMFVVDLQGHIIDVNPTASEITGIPEVDLRKKLVTEVLPIDAGVLDQLTNEVINQPEIIFRKDNSIRYFGINMTPLKDRHDELIGQLLLLRDVTEQKLAQARILEQQSMVATLQERERLARELHDGIGQVLGYVGMQAQTVRKHIQDGNTTRADSLLGRLVEVAKDAHADVRESILNLRVGSGAEWSFLTALRQYLDSFQANYGIRTEMSLSGKLGENSFAPAAGVHLLRVIQEAMTNARKHSSAHTIKIAMERDENHAYITITDDGSGFDAEQPTQGAGNHFGLVFMRERMSQIGGSLKTDSQRGVGTAVRLSVPVQD